MLKSEKKLFLQDFNHEPKNIYEIGPWSQTICKLFMQC